MVTKINISAMQSDILSSLEMYIIIMTHLHSTFSHTQETVRKLKKMIIDISTIYKHSYRGAVDWYLSGISVLFSLKISF